MDVELVLWGYIQGDTHKEIVGCSNTVNASLSVNYHQCISIIFDILEQSSFQKYTTCLVFLALRHMLYLCICVFCICIFCVCASDTWEYNFWYAWTILFSKIYHMLGLSGTSSYAVFVYLCICICVFVHETLGNISFDILGPRAFRKYIVCMV